jgi:hypothetical protein
MPTDDAYDAVLAELAKLNRAWQQSQADMSEAWRLYRDTINRAVNLLNHEVLDFNDRLKRDEDVRAKRTLELDQKLATITSGQESIRRWQWVRLGVEVMAIIAVVAYIFGRGF